MMMSATAPAGLPVPAPVAARPAAAPTELDELAEYEVVPDEELGEHRGGFTWEGVDIGLGAEMRTYPKRRVGASDQHQLDQATARSIRRLSPVR